MASVLRSTIYGFTAFYCSFNQIAITQKFTQYSAYWPLGSIRSPVLFQDYTHPTLKFAERI